MGRDVLVVAEHRNGTLDDVTFELVGHGRRLAAELEGSCVVALVGGSAAVSELLGAADRVVTVGGPELSDFNPETHCTALAAVIEATTPRVVLVAQTSMGMDLAGPLAVRTSVAHAASCVDFKGGVTITAVSQVYGGKINVSTDLGAGPCVLSVLSGAGPADAGRGDGAPQIESIEAPEPRGRVRFKRTIEPEAGDVDLEAQAVLVAVGRGIGDKDDIEIAEELAKVLGGAVAASRPVIDAGWLPRNRQVGKSGLKVSPKVYIALGISGAPEHMEGIMGADTIIAVNTDKHAPIFNYAHFGIVEDLFDVCEELTEAIEDR